MFCESSLVGSNLDVNEFLWLGGVIVGVSYWCNKTSPGLGLIKNLNWIRENWLDPKLVDLKHLAFCWCWGLHLKFCFKDLPEILWPGQICLILVVVICYCIEFAFFYKKKNIYIYFCWYYIEIGWSRGRWALPGCICLQHSSSMFLRSVFPLFSLIAIKVWNF